MSFRLNKFQIEDSDFETEEIDLINFKNDLKTNHFTVIVGNNGTGKSRLLGSIAKALKNDFRSRSSKYYFFSKFEKSSETSRVISVSNSLNDKFPLDNIYSGFRRDGIEYSNQDYIYLGTKTRLGSTNRVLIRRAIDILLENYSNKFVAKCYRHIFDYLDFHPVIKLEYNISSINSSLKIKKPITKKDLIDFITDKTTYGSVNNVIYNKFLEEYENRLEEICQFLNNLNERKDFSLEINFSNSNIQKIDKNNSLYENDLKSYEILNLLRKLNLIRSFDILLFKKDTNRPFNINDASSGEASILITLIGLIPLIEDNCCILIDEPEISLHPSWQYRYIDLLNQIFENFKGCHIIIATHSHFIISDLPLESSTIISLKKVNNKVTSTVLEFNTFGWSAEDILLNVFEMPTTRNYYISNIVAEALKLISVNKTKTKTFKEIIGTLVKLENQFKEEDPLKLVIHTIINIDNKHE
ncbi:ATP-binding protein [Chryseobacterium culicis]|uniref:Endonuclease GajA/Old nuclease/RecF-like AAA domain-containing protein n=1 Tax=Chryseobacterium culicis TaxID=680127 RepID=A0A2S9D264_CHRCI|nr:ATP-binding protein [Chryseobacterium culicis]PRB86855.1 hypothetical protein CQ022_11580 [Chryseobacterium culicis]PRB92607.1 hypothetical protein CQ033_05250 [Chryseobacterium culicis]